MARRRQRRKRRKKPRYKIDEMAWYLVRLKGDNGLVPMPIVVGYHVLESV